VLPSCLVFPSLFHLCCSNTVSPIVCGSFCVMKRARFCCFVPNFVLIPPNRAMDQFKAVQAGDHQKLRLVLTAHNVDDVDGLSCSSSLYYAARFGRVECVKVCIEMGANVNAPSGAFFREQSPLVRGCSSG
jgi:hypothetical protein